jgi:hypothetical protein
VHKALIGTPSVVVNLEDSSSLGLGVGASLLGANFEQRDLSKASLEVSSKHPVTLAVARSSFRTSQTERLCEFCGREGQSCCTSSPACDGGLGCVAQKCVELGGVGQPCDDQRCAEGAACVAGICRVECGGRGQPCCADKQCSGQLKCADNPKNAREVLVLAQRVEVEGGFFGTSEDRTLGLSNCGMFKHRARFAVTKVGAGRGECSKAWWFDPNNAHDCRVGVHYNVSVLGDIQCQLDVYATAPRKPDLCQP